MSRCCATRRPRRRRSQPPTGPTDGCAARSRSSSSLRTGAGTLTRRSSKPRLRSATSSRSTTAPRGGCAHRSSCARGRRGSPCASSSCALPPRSVGTSTERRLLSSLSVAMSWHPIPDRAAARVLGDALRRVGFTEEAVIDLLGEEAYGLTRDDVPVGVRRLPDSRLGTVLRAFFLQQSTPTADVTQAIGRAAVEALVVTGLADVGDDVSLHGRIVPVGDLFVTSDDFPGEDAEKDPADFVAAYTPTSKLCDALTPRGSVERALDIGTGSGVQAMLSASQAREVVATDVNPRALAFAELNAALNGFTNIECRLGSLFEPVEGETFDVITSNAPFVVSPENRWAYRDGGLEADQFSELIVREAVRHLSDDGYATLLVSWVAEDDDNSEARPLEWAAGGECDSWILPIYALDQLDHAVRWNVHLTGQPEPFGQVIDRWTSYLDELGVEIVTEGAVLLHRRAGEAHTARVDV